jgi:hypothetical protein
MEHSRYIVQNNERIFWTNHAILDAVERMKRGQNEGQNGGQRAPQPAAAPAAQITAWDVYTPSIAAYEYLLSDAVHFANVYKDATIVSFLETIQSGEVDCVGTPAAGARAGVPPVWN